MKANQLIILSLSALSIVITSCGGKKVAGEIKIDGSSTVYPITEAVAEEFQTENRKARVTIGVSGTGGGFKKFSRGETTISNASRPIKEKEIKACKTNGVSYIELEVAYDGLAVIINPENDWVDYFTVAELKKLWEPAAQGVIKKWSQIRKGWPNKEIHLFGPGTASGTYDYFTEAITGKSGSSRGDYTASEDDNVLVQGIARDKYALGFFGLAYYEENKDKLKLVAVNNGNGPIKPSLETVKNGTYSPLSRPLFIYVSSKGKPIVHDFINFYLEQAGAMAKEVGYIPLPQKIYDTQKKKYQAFLNK